MKTITEITNSNEYNFLRTNPHLKDKLIFLTFGGSHAYGTNTPNSDTDIRGCALNSKEDILTLNNFEQVIDNTTDTTIYSFNKLIQLLCNCNPNCIELLGCKPEHYLIYNEVGKEMLANRKMFLSGKAVNSFGGYANQQLRRLQNAVARDALNQPEKERHMLLSMKNMMMTFDERYSAFPQGGIELFIAESDKEDMETEIFMNINLKNYPLRDCKSMLNEMQEIIKVYGKLNHRNNKKEEAGLNKHAMHLIRLYLMAIDIFEKEEIITYRENDLPMLMEIRNGKYMNEDGTYQAEFFEMVDNLEKQLHYAQENSSLPTSCNMKQVNEFVASVNEKVILGRIKNSILGFY